jgi:hypothetical protein
MRASLTLVILSLSLCGSGCADLCDATRQVVDDVNHCIEDRQALRRDRRLAEEAWEDICKLDPGQPFSDEFGRGFKEGYVDYLYKGGDTAVRDWYDGYRKGAAVAKLSGYRQSTVLTSTESRGNSPRPEGSQGPLRAGRLGNPVAADPCHLGQLPAPEALSKVEQKSIQESARVPGQDPTPPAAAARPAGEADGILLPPAAPQPAARTGVVPAALAVQAVAPAPPAPSRPDGITLRPMLPGMGDYEIHIGPMRWLQGKDE